MSLKSERFEMRFDRGLLDRVDEWIEKEGKVVSRAEAVRRLIEAGLDSSGHQGLRLSKAESLTTWLLCEILKQNQNYEDQDTVKLIQDALYEGHHWALDMELTGVLHNEISNKAALSFVMDTMSMWRQLLSTYHGYKNSEKKRIDVELGKFGRRVKFDGFDGNEEGEFYSIARFLVKNVKRFEEFNDLSLNSHSNMVPQYSAMLKVFRSVDRSQLEYKISVDSFIQILTA